MSAEGWVLIIGAAGAQLGMIIQNLKVTRSVGNPNGLGTIHEALKTIDVKVDSLGDRVGRLEARD